MTTLTQMDQQAKHLGATTYGDFYAPPRPYTREGYTLMFRHYFDAAGDEVAYCAAFLLTCIGTLETFSPPRKWADEIKSKLVIKNLP